MLRDLALVDRYNFAQRSFILTYGGGPPFWPIDDLATAIEPDQGPLSEFANNQVWSMDLLHDQLADGHSFRVLNVLDDHNRQGLGMEIDLSLPSAHVIRYVALAVVRKGHPC